MVYSCRHIPCAVHRIESSAHHTLADGTAECACYLVLGADGTVETITGTTIHPVWSVDRQSWVPLAELTDGETLQGLDGLAVRICEQRLRNGQIPGTTNGLF
ncbi:MAG: hypothetical protein ACKO9Q_29230 [Pirellula sp.]